MKETHCNNPSCGIELVHTEGRRPKKYCSDKCRISHHLAQKKAPRFVQLETHNKVKRQLDELLSESLKLKTNSGLVTEFDSKINYSATTEQSYDGKRLDEKINDEHPMYAVPSEENKEAVTRISELQRELKNPPANPKIGLRMWKAIREKEIKELQSQLK